MDFESCNSAAQFAIPQSQNSFVIPNANPFIEFGLNMLATVHIGLADVIQPLSFVVFKRVHRLKQCRYFFHDNSISASHLLYRNLNFKFISIAHMHES